MRSSADGVPTTRSESPEPRLSSMITRANDPRRSSARANDGSSQWCSIWFQKVLNSTRSGGPLPKAW